MSHLRCVHLKSVADLRAATSDWDNLWWRSDVASPVARAEPLARWLEQFRPRGRFHALAVTDSRRWLAALPLVSCRVGWLISAAAMPSNSWLPCGDLLLDSSADVDTALDLLLTEVGQLPWQMLWLNDAVPEAPRWQALLRACVRAGITTSYHERYRVGRVAIEGTWEAYQHRLPKNHRQGLRRNIRRLADEGDVQFEMQSCWEPDDVQPWLHESFALEDRGWKGTGGSSVLRTPGMFDFFLREAQELARLGHLETAALRLDGRMLAFAYGFRAKGVYFASKISYDEKFAAFSPSQLLFYHILEQLYREDDMRALDFMGPLNQSLSRWRPQTYGIGRIAIARHKFLGRAAMYAYEHCWCPIRGRKSAARSALQDPCHAGSTADEAPA